MPCATTTKAPPPRVSLQVMNYLSANACGRRLSLYFIALQGCTSFHHLTFHSVHCLPPASATHARVFPSFHCAQPNPPFHSAPLWLFLLTTQIAHPKREASFHPTPFATFHLVITLAFPNPMISMPAIQFATKATSEFLHSLM